MPKTFFRPPAHIVKDWPEVFEGMYMNTMPIAYLNLIKLEFKDGRIWEIAIQELVNKSSISEVSENLIQTITEYKNEILKVDFDLDVDRLKSDVKNETKKIF